jgi:hypothetical protein
LYDESDIDNAGLSLMARDFSLIIQGVDSELAAITRDRHALSAHKIESQAW